MKRVRERESQTVHATEKYIGREKERQPELQYIVKEGENRSRNNGIDGKRKQT